MAHVSGHYTVALWGGVGIVHWMRQADAPAMTHVRRCLRKLVDAQPSGVSFIHVVDEGAGLPSPEARSELSAMMGSFAEATVCVAVVLRGSGFWASAMQSLLTGLRLFAPPRGWTLRFASSTSDLGSWLPGLHVERTHQYFNARELELAIADVLSTGARAASLTG